MLLRTPHRGSSPPAVSSERTWSKQKGSDQTPPAHTEGPWEAKQINFISKNAFLLTRDWTGFLKHRACCSEMTQLKGNALFFVCLSPNKDGANEGQL